MGIEGGVLFHDVYFVSTISACCFEILENNDHYFTAQRLVLEVIFSPRQLEILNFFFQISKMNLGLVHVTWKKIFLKR